MNRNSFQEASKYTLCLRENLILINKSRYDRENSLSHKTSKSFVNMTIFVNMTNILNNIKGSINISEREVRIFNF